MNDLPPGWTWTTFGEVARVASDLVDPAGYPDYPHLAPNHVESHTGRLFPLRTVAEDRVTSPKHRFRGGQIVYSKIRPYLGKVAMPAVGGLCSADMYPIDSYIEPRFLFWWMLTPRFTTLASGHQARTVLPKINERALTGLPVPVPPLTEQGRIVAAVEGELSRVDKGCVLLSAVAQRVDRFREHVMLLAATGRLGGRPAKATAARPTPAGVADGDLPGLPSTWQWCRLGDIADVVGGVTKDSKRQSAPDLVEVPYLRVANVQRGFLDLSSVATIRVPATKADALQLQPGDVLLNEGGDRDKLGRGWIWEGQIEPCIHQNHVFRARVRDDLIHPKLLAWHANSFGKAWFQANGRQSVNLASISLSKVKQFPVPLPPIEEQAQLVSIAEQYLSLLDKLEAAIGAAQVRAGKLRTSVLSTALAGRLVEQDPNDEPASELLARIRAERANVPARKRTRSPRTPRQAPAPSHGASAGSYQEEELPL